MADVATLQEGITARLLGADIISTTLSGYTLESPDTSDEPDFELFKGPNRIGGLSCYFRRAYLAAVSGGQSL